VRRPNYYSPTKHPDRALARRNDVLDQMAANGSLSAAQAVTEKQKGLLE
jgi:penicillin-binding protein 1B